MEVKMLTVNACERLLERLDSLSFDREIDAKKNMLNFYQCQEKKLQVRLPLYGLSSASNPIPSHDQPNYVLLMIRSGIASIGYFENGENIDHKVFRAYMVRKKQGKSQIKHLKTKGKSRAGSRVRLAETWEFFEEINARLQQYFDTYRIDRIGLGCAVTLIPYLFGGKVATPFEKNDPRLFKIPKHVSNPTYEALLAVNDFLSLAEIQFSPELKQLLFPPTASGFKNEASQESDEDDDW